ncbi:MAG TPA: hypothetical protein VLA37_00610, partial [Sphingomonadaceae bacterium]|nr:hypothetical protein [Sphingomonadaceae bacterium]
MTSASTSVSENQTTGSDVSDEGLDAESLAAIRSLIAEEPALAAAPPSRRRSEVEDIAPPEPAPAPQPAPRKRTKADALPVLEEAVNDTPEYLDERDSQPSRRRGLRLPRLGLRRKARSAEDVAYDGYAEPAAVTPPRRAQPQATEEGASARAKAAVLGYRPTPRHIALAAL